MLSRPKPGESEEDLLKFQSQFLAAGAPSAAQVVKKADKRKGDSTGGVQDTRDVVKLEEFPDLPPTLSPAPPKKSKLKSSSVHFADADPEELLDQHDRHITAVFTKIIERDTSMMAVTAPLSSGVAFPRVFHRSQFKSEERPTLEKRSIFAQQIAARKALEADAVPPSAIKTSLPTAGLSAPGTGGSHRQVMETSVQRSENGGASVSVAGPHIVTGEGLRVTQSKEEAQRIHQENVERLRAMSQEEIRLEQEKLLAQLDPSLVNFLKSQSSRGERRMNVELPEPPTPEVPWQGPLSGAKNSPREEEPGMESSAGSDELIKKEDMESSMKEESMGSSKETEKLAEKESIDSMKREERMKEDVMESSSNKDTLEEEEQTMELAVDDLPMKPEKEWVHMDKVEIDKLEWMKDLPPARQKRTKKGLQARFSLKGEIIPPDADLPTHLGLHHHGEESERAGYSLQELFHLSRSQVIQQRALALQVLGRIVQKAKQGEFAMSLKGSVLRLLLDAGFLFLMRFSLDDSAENVIAGSVHALWALLVSPDDEEHLDRSFSWYQGAMVFPFLPNKDEEEDDDDEDEEEEIMKNKVDEKQRQKEKEENKPDSDVARYDVIKGLLKTKILHRLRYILEVVRPAPSVVVDILDILTRVARHSTEACTQVVDCPRLMETVIQNFLPAQWICPSDGAGKLLTSLYGIPCASAMKLLRVLASAGRNLSARLLNKFELKARLGRFVAEDPQDLPLQREEAVRLSTEAFRLWAVAAGYGQACDLYRDLYPVLVKTLQALSRLVGDCRRDRPAAQLLIQRAAAVVTLLSNVTQTAACTAELQQQLESSLPDDGPQIPPPPVSWIHISGLKPFLEACLKRSLQEISCPATWDILRPLTTTYIIYLGVYFRACSRQPSLNPIEYVEDAERLTSEVLLPLLRQPVIVGMWDLLRPCSAVCNKLSCSPAPESIASIASLSCNGGKPPMNVAGSKSPFPFLTSLLFLINGVTGIHKGLLSKFSFVLESKELNNYLRQSWTSASPSVTHSSAWILRHEYHLQYFVLSLAQKLAVACPEQSRHASLYHCAAMMLVGRLLPGSEHLAHELLLSFIFNPEFIPEGNAGGPEAADFSDILHIHPDAQPAPPGSAASVSPNLSRGALLREAYLQLPSIRACYLTHFSHLELALGRSQARYKGQTHHIQSMLLPEVKGPSLPSDWPFLPLILLYNKVANAETRGNMLNSLPPDLVNIVTRNLQWILLLETWRAGVLHDIPAAAKLARLACVFLTGGDLFLEGPVHCYTAALLALYCQPKALDALQLDVPLPGLFSFYDLFDNLLEQFEGVSFGDPLFGAFVLIPLQRRFSVQLRRSVLLEHVGALRSLGIPLKEFPIPLERYTSPPEDCLDLLRLYFRTLMNGALRQSWCPILYAVAVAHMNSFIFSQDPVAQEVDIARKSMLRKTWLLTDEVLKKHLIYFKRPNIENPMGFDLFEQLPPLRQRYLETVIQKKTHQLSKGHTGS